MTATPFTRREALKNGVLGVASLTVAERLLAYGGQNEALAAMKPTLAKTGLRAASCSRRASRWPCRRAFGYVRFDRAGTTDVRRPADARPATTAPATSRAAATRSGSSATRRASSGAARRARVNAYDPIAQGGVTVSHFNTRTGKVLGNALVLNGTDNNCNGGVTPWGTWLTRRGEHGRQGAGLRRRARLCVRGPRARQLDRRAAPDQGDGAVRPRGVPGRPEDRDRLHDRGQRRPRRRLLSLPAPPQGQAPSRRQAADARHPRPAEVQHRRTIRSVGEKLECRWVDIKDPDPNGADRLPAGGLHAGPPRRRREVPRASRAAPSRRAAATSRPPTAATPARARSGGTRRTTRTSSAARCSCVYESPLPQGARRPRRDHAEPARRHPRLRGRRERGRQGPALAVQVHLAERQAARLRHRHRADAAARQHRGGPVPVSTPTAGTTRRRRARASATARPRASATARTASGCSSTSSIRARRSRSPGPGTRAGSEPVLAVASAP